MYRYSKELLKTARTRQGMTQSEAADLAGLTLRQYQKYELGEQVPSAARFMTMANALDIKPGEFQKVQPSMDELIRAQNRRKNQQSAAVSDRLFKRESEETPEQAYQRGLAEGREQTVRRIKELDDEGGDEE